ncbi:hypothetical protein GGR50DRAFT_583083 [Xylaria sp. CBS 124048]|nr:hypothetical protein GGR50DRAFT_583083 [Xylaria sp. CBS 124048]
MSTEVKQLLSDAAAEARAADSEIGSAYDLLLNDLSSNSVPETLEANLKEVVNRIFSSNLRVVALRNLLERFISLLDAFNQPHLSVEVGQHALNVITNQPSATFLDQIASLRELLASAYESKEDFLEAAKVLSEIQLDATQRKVTNEERVTLWVRIIRNYLEVDDTTAAETYLNKLKNIIYSVSDSTLNLHFRLSQARIQDANREFLSASSAYHEISLSPSVTEDERLHTLAMAVRCAILAPAGPLRSRALGRLHKDERVVGLDEFSMLEKVFFDRLIAPAEVDKFAQSLAPHQLATTSDGSTVLAKAIVEHNLLAASRLYSNIEFAALAALLGLDIVRAEDTTAKMIEQGRLVGRIDQIEEIIWFERGEASGEKGSGRAEVTVGKEMRRWDAHVQGIAEELEEITNALQREYPEFVAANLVV